MDFAVDPLFKKTSADFDEGGARGLLLNHLSIDQHCKIIFDASDATIECNTEELDGEEHKDKEEESVEEPAKGSSPEKEDEAALQKLNEAFLAEDAIYDTDAMEVDENDAELDNNEKEATPVDKDAEAMEVDKSSDKETEKEVVSSEKETPVEIKEASNKESLVEISRLRGIL